MNKSAFIAALVAAALPACRSVDNCRPVGATRCSGYVVQVCESNGEWTYLLDCHELGRSVGEPWVCTSTPFVTEHGVEDDHTCVPAREIALVADAGSR
jgi:hypothetical protein